MSKKYLAIILFSIISTMVGSQLLLSNYLTKKTLLAIDESFEGTLSRVLENVTSGVRNELLDGNIHGARIKLERQKQQNFFHEYRISKYDGTIVDSSDNYDVERSAPSNFEIDTLIYFGSTSNTWGKISFVGKKDWAPSVRSKLFKTASISSLSLAASFFIVSTFILIFFIFSQRFVAAMVGSVFLDNTSEDINNSRIFFRLWHPLYRTLKTIKSELNEANDTKSKYIENEAIYRLSRQVAHDIRSPLSALNIVSNSLREIPGDTRQIFKTALIRINDIANGLLTYEKATSSHATNQIGSALPVAKETFRLLDVLNALVAEKEVEYQHLESLKICRDFKISETQLITINKKDLLCAISNIINNSAEAMLSRSGQITIASRKYRDRISISIHDNGSGIPEFVLKQLGQEKVSFGKRDDSTSGTGLGISLAKRTIEASGGIFSITSKIDVGTVVEFIFPS